MLPLLLLVAAAHARTQAHLPLQPGLPPVPSGPLTGLYVGDPPVNYASDVLLGGSKNQVVSAATHDVDAVSEPFHEWDVNHAQGPSVLDCPDGFALTKEHTCVFLEFRRPQESCPYGTFRDRSGQACVQVDSVPPDRTCPAGFEYFMRGCIRKTQTSPLLTCPAGYSQLENLCYSVSSVPPQKRCPQGTSLVTMSVDDPHVPPLVRCQTEIVSKPEYQCPAESRLITEPLAGKLITATTNDLHQWQLSPDVPRCLSTHEAPPVASCVAGFSLVSAAQFDTHNPPDDLSGMESSVDRLDELLCAKILEHRGELSCDPGSTLVWPQVLEPVQMAAVQADPYRGIRCRAIGAMTKERFLESDTPPPRIEQLFSHNESRILKSTQPITVLNENIELFGDEGGVSVSPQSMFKQSLAAALNKRRRPGRNLQGLHELHFPPWVSQDLRAVDAALKGDSALKGAADLRGASERTYLFPQGQYPKIQFAKAFCQQQDLHGLKWVDPPTLPMFGAEEVPSTDLTTVLNQLLKATDSLLKTPSKDTVFTSIHSVPVCREVQTMPPRLSCVENARVKCLQDEFTPIVEETAEVEEEEEEEEEDRRRLLAAAPPLVSKRTKAKKGTGQAERHLHEISDYSFVMANQEELAIRSCIEHSKGRAVCLMTEMLSPATPFCPSSDQILTLRPMKGIETNGLKSMAGSTNYQVAVCQVRGDQEPELECPFGVGNVGNASGRCDVLLAQPLSAACPEGFTKTTHEKPNHLMENYKKLFGSKKGGPIITPNLPDPNPGANGVCELIEYADYQITCPHGYRREKAKNTAAACVAEKAVPPSVICPPGFLPALEGPMEQLALDNPRACVKQVVVAPTVISYPTEQTPPTGSEVLGGALATACVLTKEKRLSCGVERKYHGMTEMARQKFFGEQFKAKMDRKSKLHAEKYASPSFD